ncbi:MAG: ABC transporter permease, partial [Rhizobiaceae bacterium]|nr:ABC transporter permease [Rhizobiaceae bacterium]
MLGYLANRVLTMLGTLVVISVLVFIVIQLPPGDYLSTYIAELRAQGESVSDDRIGFLREQYGLDKPLPLQYFDWVTGLVQGDLGYS